jgi:hypothetical protein
MEDSPASGLVSGDFIYKETDGTLFSPFTITETPAGSGNYELTSTGALEAGTVELKSLDQQTSKLFWQNNTAIVIS